MKQLSITLSSAFFLLSMTFSVSQGLNEVVRLPSIVNETSGIEVSSPDRVWTFNDSGGEPALYLCDLNGNLLKTVTISGAWNRDWEDLAQDDQGNFYIGNIGNNGNDTRDLTIFKIPNPDLITGTEVSAEVISFAYEDQMAFPPSDARKNFDCEALFWWDGSLYLCSKNRTNPFDGKTYLYQLPDAPGTYTAKKIGEFDTQGTDVFNYWITAADISPDGAHVALLSSDKMWVFSDFQENDFFGGEVQVFSFSSSTQKEAIVFVDEETLYITDEDWGDVGRNLYQFRLPRKGPFEGIPNAVPGLVEAEFFDEGGNGSGYYDLSVGNEGGEFRQSDVDIERCEDVTGGFNVGWFEAGEWLQYSLEVAYSGTFDLALRVASETPGEVFFEIDEGQVGGLFSVPASGGWQDWQTVEYQSIELDSGLHTFRVVIATGGFNLNYLEFSDQVLANEPLYHTTSIQLPNPLPEFWNPALGRNEELRILAADGRCMGKYEAGTPIDASRWPTGIYQFVVVSPVKIEVFQVLKP